jgi:hypothetical protein
MNARKLLMPTLLATAAALGGCRSDGGFGRKDSSRSLGWSLSRLSAHTAEDADRTAETVAGAPAALGRSVERSSDNLGDTYRLYFEGTEKRR